MANAAAEAALAAAAHQDEGAGGEDVKHVKVHVDSSESAWVCVKCGKKNENAAHVCMQCLATRNQSMAQVVAAAVVAQRPSMAKGSNASPNAKRRTKSFGDREEGLQKVHEVRDTICPDRGAQLMSRFISSEMQRERPTPAVNFIVFKLFIDAMLWDALKTARYATTACGMTWGDMRQGLVRSGSAEKETSPMATSSTQQQIQKSNNGDASLRKEEVAQFAEQSARKAQRAATGTAAVTECANTRKICEVMESMLEDRTGNSEAGAHLLRRLLFPELDSSMDEASPRGSADSKSSQEDDAELLHCTSLLPDQRTVQELAVINVHLGSHPMFNVARGRMKTRMLRHVSLRTFREAYTVVVLQGELADSAFLIHSGQVAVHKLSARQQQDGGQFFAGELRSRLLRGTPVAKTAEELSPLLGNRIATLDSGEAFGENGFVANGYGRRCATVVTTVPDCRLFCIGRRPLLTARPPPGALSNFDDAPHAPLVRILRRAPETRTLEEIEVIMHHCAWQPLFAALERKVAHIACRHLRLVSIPAHQVVVLEGDVADSYFVIYHGAAEVCVAGELGALNRWKSLHLWDDAAQSEDVRMKPRHLPGMLIGRRVFKLTKGMAFGESGLDPTGLKRRNATVVSLGASKKRPLLLLALYRDDIRAKPARCDTGGIENTAHNLQDTSCSCNTSFEIPTFTRVECPIIIDR